VGEAVDLAERPGRHVSKQRQGAPRTGHAEGAARPAGEEALGWTTRLVTDRAEGRGASQRASLDSGEQQGHLTP
jgi:hypothetical protein